MALKSIIALFLGLVLQLSQFQACLNTRDAESCGGDGFSVSCCDGLDSCPCASQRDSDPKPAPLAAAGTELKWLVARPLETKDFAAVACPIGNPAIPRGCLLEVRSAYAGVPLSVAFCRFVI
ncbi:hypothetical protein HQ447_07415 [bacterium]|nr:hypothetical protein [bacterium]